MNSLNQVPKAGRSIGEVYRSVSSIVIPLVALMLLTLLAVAFPRDQEQTESAPPQTAAESRAINPELKVLDYPQTAAESRATNPELKVLDYPQTAAESRAINPELKVLDYPVDKAAVQIVTSPEAAVLRFPEAMDRSQEARDSTAIDLYVNPELKVLDDEAAASEMSATDNLRRYHRGR